VLFPAHHEWSAEINDFGTVALKMTPEKLGRSIAAVRFDWKWKTIDEARVTDEENARAEIARHKEKGQSEAPPTPRQAVNTGGRGRVVAFLPAPGPARAGNAPRNEA